MNKVVFPVCCTWNEEESAIYQFIVMQKYIPVICMYRGSLVIGPIEYKISIIVLSTV